MVIKRIHKRANYKLVLARVGLIMVVVLAFLLWPAAAGPVPNNIKKQIGFTVLYPKGYNIDPKSWNYTSDQQLLAFKVDKDNYSIAFTEQRVPLAYQNDLGAYNRFIGSLRPSANFDVPLGTVSLATFVTSGDYQTEGQSGILNAKGTLLIAHPSRDISGDEWRNLFDSLKVSR